MLKVFFRKTITNFVIDPTNDPLTYTAGGLVDSTYEYYGKEYLLLNGGESKYEELYTNSIEAINDNLVFKPMVEGDPDILFVGNLIRRSSSFLQEDNEMSHLACFVGGMYALGGKIFNRPQDLETAAKLTDGCVWAYNSTRTGVMPENFHVRRCPSDGSSCHFDFDTIEETDAANKAQTISELTSEGVNMAGFAPTTQSMPEVEVIADGRGGTRWPVSGYYDMPRSFLRMQASYILRPEAIESVFYMYRVSGDRSWQEKGWNMIESVLGLTQVQENGQIIGYSGVNDVTDDRGTRSNHRDEEESFWMGETLKYAYLLQAEPENVSLDEFVFNTEAHPVKRPS